MKKNQIPQGYASSFPAHTDPAVPKPLTPIQHEKEAQTLMGHCLKELIKERLFGKVVNYKRVSRNKPDHLTPLLHNSPENSSSNVKSASYIQDIRQGRSSVPRTNLQKRVNDRYEHILKKNTGKASEQRQMVRKSQDSTEQPSALQASRHKKNKSSISNYCESNESSARGYQQIDNYKYSSFLSAIEEDDHRIFPNPKKKNHKLNPLNSNLQLADKLQRLKAMTKSPARVEDQKFSINTAFWEMVCKRTKPKHQQQQEHSNNSQLITKDQKAVENTSFNTRSMISGKSSVALSMVVQQKSKSLSTKSCFSRELFSEYLKNQRLVIKNLTQLLLSFFELSSKTFDEMKIEDYKQITSIMVTASPRVWAVCAFRYFDTDQNSRICVNDLFKTYQQLDQLETELKQNNENSEPAHSLTMLAQLKKSIEILRQFILKETVDIKINEQKRYDCQQTSEGLEIKYLQQSLLGKKQIRYSDLSLILGAGMKTNGRQVRGSVIETTKQIRIKFSSCYRFSLLATDHNEQTRLDRQYIQTLKDSLKKQKQEKQQRERENELINKKLRGIKYATFFQNKFFQVVKDVAFQIFGLQTNEIK